MMSPPATLLIISCVARVRPKVSTEAMAVMDEVRTIPEHLRSSYAHLKPYFDRF